jgi:hypothetical protein
MKENKEKQDEKDTSAKAAVERGNKAIAAEEAINKKDPADPRTKNEKSEDAERWHNEG